MRCRWNLVDLVRDVGDRSARRARCQACTWVGRGVVPPCGSGGSQCGGQDLTPKRISERIATQSVALPGPQVGKRLSMLEEVLKDIIEEVKATTRERIHEHIATQSLDLPVPQVAEENCEVVQVIPTERISKSIEEQIVSIARTLAVELPTVAVQNPRVTTTVTTMAPAMPATTLVATPAPAVVFVAPASAVYAAPAPVVECKRPAPAVS